VAILLDNLPKDRTLDSAHIASVLTTVKWSDREISTSNLPRLPVRAALVATGNDVKVSEEIARRALPIRLDPHMDNPYDRRGYRHPHLDDWVAEHRGELVWAVLTLVQAWVAAGLPRGISPRASMKLGRG